MNLKNLVWLGVLSASATLSTAHAASYVSDGRSFASLTADASVERSANNSFEFFTSSALMGRQQTTSLFEVSNDNELRAVSSSRTSVASSSDTWLMLLIGGGLVALQLRRKQKSLPHRPLASIAAE